MTTTRKVRTISASTLKGGGSWLAITSGRTRYHLITGRDTHMVGLFKETPRGLEYIDAEGVSLNSQPIPSPNAGRAAVKRFVNSPLIATLEWTT